VERRGVERRGEERRGEERKRSGGKLPTRLIEFCHRFSSHSTQNRSITSLGAVSFSAECRFQRVV
jgi:hypothetical protein